LNYTQSDAFEMVFQNPARLIDIRSRTNDNSTPLYFSAALQNGKTALPYEDLAKLIEAILYEFLAERGQSRLRYMNVFLLRRRQADAVRGQLRHLFHPQRSLQFKAWCGYSCVTTMTDRILQLLAWFLEERP
jgi:hypothetical protein